jgi:hypothetical protein
MYQEPAVVIRNLNHTFGTGNLRKPVLSDVGVDYIIAFWISPIAS